MKDGNAGRKLGLRYGPPRTVRFSIAPDTVRSVHVESIFYSGARPVYRSVSGHFSRIQRGVYVDGRPRYDPGTYDSYCARSRNERSLHDLPLLDPARSLIRRYSDLLIANNAPHTVYRLYLRPRIDMTTFPSMRKSMSRVENGRYVARPRRREKRVIGERIHSSDPYNTRLRETLRSRRPWNLLSH